MNQKKLRPSGTFRQNFQPKQAIILSLISLSSASHALDYNYGDVISQNVTITADSHARALGNNVSVFFDNSLGSVYDRGTAQDITFINMNLLRLSNAVITSDATLRVPAASAHGGAINNGVLNQINAPWTYSPNAAVPNFSPILDIPSITGNFPTGTFAAWAIPQSSIQNIQSNLSNFYGFALTADADSQLHFNGLAQLIVDTEVSEIRIVSANDWSAATFDEFTKTLNIAGSSNVTGGNVLLSPFTTLSVTENATLDNGIFAGNFDNNGGTLIFSSNSDQTLTGSISGTGNMEKSGSGKLTLAGPNTMAGTISIAGGVLSLSGSSSLTQQNPITIDNGASLSNDAAPSTSYSLGVLSLNGGTLSATSTPNVVLGNFTLRGNVNVEGVQPTIISADVRVGDNADRSFFVASESSLNITGRLGHFNSNSWGYITKSGDGTMKLSGPLEVGGITVNQGKLILEDAAAAWEMDNRSLNNNATLEFLVNSGTRTMPRTLNGSGNVIKTGSGTIALTGTVTYTGNTSVTSGVFSVGNGTTARNLGDWSTVTIASGAQMNLNYSGNDVVGELILDQTSMPSGTYNATTHPQFFTGAGNLVVVGPSSSVWASNVNGDWDVFNNWQNNVIANGADNTATFNGATGTVISLQAPRIIGNLNFSALDYTITNAAYSLILNNVNSPESTIDVASGRTATINSRLSSTNTLLKTGDGTLSLFAGEGDNYSSTYNHNTSGLTIRGGTVELTSQYTRFSNINIESGSTLRATVPWATGASNPWFNGRSAGSITVQAGGTLTSTNIANSIMEGLILLGGNVTAPGITSADWGAFILASSLNADGSATSTISAETAIAGTQNINVALDSNLVISGMLRNRFAATGGINKTGPGTLLLTGDKLYSGPTIVSEGVLQLGDGVTTSSLALSTITNNAELVLHPAGNISWNQSVSGVGSLTKRGSNSVTVTAAQNYTGNTVIEAGTLSLQNNATQALQANLVNANFELPNYTGDQFSYLASDGVTGGWSFTSGGISAVRSPGGAPWFTATPPSGDQAAFLQNNASMTQTITVSTASTYQISFYTANRPGYNASNLSVRINGNNLGSWTSAQLATGGNFTARNSSAIALQPGTYTLVFETTQVGGDSATIIDDILISEPISSGSLFFEVLGNGLNNQVLGNGNAVINGLFNLNLANADRSNGNVWTLVNHATLNESYGPNFRISSDLGNFVSNGDTWTLVNNQETWTFQESTGVLSLSTVTNPFLTWMNGFFPNETDLAIVGPTADPDQDGIVNLLEFVLDGGNPNQSNQGILPTLDASGDNFVFTFRRRAETANVTSQTFQYGTNLTGWSDLSITPSSQVLITPDTPSTGIDQVTITIPKGTNTKLFGRLLVGELVN